MKTPIKLMTMLLCAASMSTIFVACSGNGNSTEPSVESEPQTPCNNPQVLVETFAEYMQQKNYEDAALLFVEFSEGGKNVMDLYRKSELLKIGNMYAGSENPEIQILENDGTNCRVKTTVNLVMGGSSIEWENYLTLKKVNSCWRIDNYSTK